MMIKTERNQGSNSHRQTYNQRFSFNQSHESNFNKQSINSNTK